MPNLVTLMNLHIPDLLEQHIRNSKYGLHIFQHTISLSLIIFDVHCS